MKFLKSADIIWWAEKILIVSNYTQDIRKSPSMGNAVWKNLVVISDNNKYLFQFGCIKIFPLLCQHYHKMQCHLFKWKIFNPLSMLRTTYFQWMKVSYNSETFTQVYQFSLKLLTGTKHLQIKSNQALSKSMMAFR